MATRNLFFAKRNFYDKPSLAPPDLNPPAERHKTSVVEILQSNPCRIFAMPGMERIDDREDAIGHGQRDQHGICYGNDVVFDDVFQQKLPQLLTKLQNVAS